ncbi:MAG: TIGR00341 family protein, partial [Bdellovibrionaceae bacterium]|nr:TIGR00341 family protein [Pseudobdellovibrionaceae bacterium]
MSLQTQLLRAIRSLSQIKALLNIKSGFDERGATTAIRDNVNLTSANAWSLIFAIFIASIGLNVNSVAVIIGAMLISPLMGPIVGAGLALGVNDFSLLRRSILNLAYAVGISVVTSTLYFLISPLSEIQSELLARTRPTFYDVLVAILGGAAGIVATSSKERGNAIPGVAIATALMPPLCTAGFGIAKGEIGYLVGALYLFVINSIFICISTYV